MKLSTWAKKNGLQYGTAYSLFKKNMLPVPVIQLQTGTILVQEEEQELHIEKVILYARVSSHDQKKDLDSQLNRLRDFAAAQGLKVHKEVKEIASGMNDKRKKLNEILLDKTITTIIVEHKDRLARFGVEMLLACLKASGRKVIVINEEEFKDDIIQDFVDLVTSMCARIYGRRSAKNRAKKALKAIQG